MSKDRTMIVNGYRIEPGAYLTRASLTRADLTRASLTRANLTRANLTGANLAGATLYGANLYGANLAGANLTGADLTGADLTGATLYGANLAGANLTGANLTGTDLYGANLTGANLTGANLTGAKLAGADLTGADLTGVIGVPALLAAELSITPEGDLIGWKKAYTQRGRRPAIVRLCVPASARRSNATGRKCRCEYADVLALETLAGKKLRRMARVVSGRGGVYETGKRVFPENGWEPDRWRECAPGIHFFITREEAVAYP